MKRCKFLVLLVILIMADICLTACSEKAISNTADYIGIDAAKEFALKAAGVSSDLAVFSSAGLDSKNGTFYYQVVFTENGVEYKYAIDALTGVVIEESYSSQETENLANSDSMQTTSIEESQSTYSETQSVNTETQPTDIGAPSVIAEPQLAIGDGTVMDVNMALSIALTHAGLTEQEIYSSKVETDVENGQRIFEVNFVSSGGVEYEYELNAENGSVIKFDYDAESLFLQAAASGAGIISESQAKQVVQDWVPGAKAENIAIHLREDDNRMEYKCSLIYDNMEYEFKIDAYSGGVIECEAELIGW